MIIRNDINPESNIYYLGAIFLSRIKTHSVMNIENFLNLIVNDFPSISINQILYTLDWLYLLDLINLTKEGNIKIETK